MAAERRERLGGLRSQMLRVKLVGLAADQKSDRRWGFVEPVEAGEGEFDFEAFERTEIFGDYYRQLKIRESLPLSGESREQLEGDFRDGLYSVLSFLHLSSSEPNPDVLVISHNRTLDFFHAVAPNSPLDKKRSFGLKTLVGVYIDGMSVNAEGQIVNVYEYVRQPNQDFLRGRCESFRQLRDRMHLNGDDVLESAKLVFVIPKSVSPSLPLGVDSVELSFTNAKYKKFIRRVIDNYRIEGSSTVAEAQNEARERYYRDATKLDRGEGMFLEVQRRLRRLR